MAVAGSLRATAASIAESIERTRDDTLQLLAAVPDNVARRLADALGHDPDDVAPPDGDDGDDVGRDGGRTPLERRLRAAEGDARVAALITTSPVETADLARAAGIGRAERAWAADVLAMLDDADEVTAEWVAGEAEDVYGLFADTVGRTMRRTLRDIALLSVLGPVDEVAELRALRGRLAGMATDADVDLATARGARIAQDARRAALAASGRDVRLAYVGPDDAKTRPFCDALVARAFTAEQLARADNGQTAGPVRIDCGGYRCRHSVIAVDAADVGDLGLTAGTDEDISRANRAARGKRR